MLTIWDRALILTVMAAAALSFFLLPKAIGATKGERSVIIQSGSRPIQSFPINQDRVINMDGQDGFCVVEVEAGRVRVKKSDCPKKLCQSQGWIDDIGELIVCLPHQTVINVSSKNTEASEVDAVVR